MIYKFYLIEKCRILCRKTKMCAFNITFLHVFVYYYHKEYEKLVFTEKSKKKINQKILFSSNFSQI